MLISIVMPCYNSEKTITQSINSVIEQTYKNWELIIIDDGSTDSTLSIAKKIAANDKRIKVLSLPKNTGTPAEPRNNGLEYSNGDYIAFLDSDDLWSNNKLELQLSFMIKNDISLSCTAYTIKDTKGKIFNYYPPLFVNYSDLLSNNSIGCLTAMVKKELISKTRFKKIGHEDYAFWLVLLKKTDGVYCLNELLATYNKMENSVSSNKKKLFIFFWNVYRKSEKFSIPRSFYFCIRYFINVIWFKYK